MMLQLLEKVERQQGKQLTPQHQQNLVQIVELALVLLQQMLLELILIQHLMAQSLQTKMHLQLIKVLYMLLMQQHN